MNEWVKEKLCLGQWWWCALSWEILLSQPFAAKAHQKKVLNKQKRCGKVFKWWIEEQKNKNVQPKGERKLFTLSLSSSAQNSTSW